MTAVVAVVQIAHVCYKKVCCWLPEEANERGTTAAGASLLQADCIAGWLDVWHIWFLPNWSIKIVDVCTYVWLYATAHVSAVASSKPNMGHTATAT